ncbi:hypothetical protein [Streptococcus dysgalactiae]|uniref:hypothetical protein n=1 Tax=Streptococcus dysgalactiae TaxID=1334 RepID=UPI003FD6D86C
MKKIILLFSVLLGVVFLGGNVHATDVNSQNYDVFYTDSTETEKVLDVVIVSEELNESNSIFKSASVDGVHVKVWMQVATKWGGTPQLDKYWHVKYINGVKYQGYVYWTGQKRIFKHAPVQFEFEFGGTLNRA